MAIYSLLWSLPLLVILPLGQNIPDAVAERYRYEARPLDSGTAEERTDMEIRSAPGGITYFARTTGPDGTEEISALTDREGRLISASQRRTGRDGKLIGEAQARRDDERMILARNRREQSFDIPGGMPPAMDGSLLLLLRSFPFDTDETRQAFMVDFSGISITVSIRQAGMEAITVPAGTYTCYRMELIVNIPLLWPKIEYWISKTPPHFLVKSIGKRGPFTPSSVTSLISTR